MTQDQILGNTDWGMYTMSLLTGSCAESDGREVSGEKPGLWASEGNAAGCAC